MMTHHVVGLIGLIKEKTYPHKVPRMRFIMKNEPSKTKLTK